MVARPPARPTLPTNVAMRQRGAQDTLKYLEITLDSRLNFKAHFKQLIPRVQGVAMHLLPNVNGPGVKAKSLFTEVTNDPVWGAHLGELHHYRQR